MQVLSFQIAFVHYNLYRYWSDSTTEVNPQSIVDNLESWISCSSFWSTNTNALLICSKNNENCSSGTSWNEVHSSVNIEPYFSRLQLIKCTASISFFQEVLEAIMFVSKVLYCIFMYIVILNIISVNIGVHFVKQTVRNLWKANRWILVTLMCMILLYS